jgi:hypothetical protein
MKKTTQKQFPNESPPMSASGEKRPLKVCSTCRHWTPKLKGFCGKIQQGAGKFHICASWSSTATEAGDVIAAPTQEAAGAGRA